MSWPQPNEHGVYADSDASERRFDCDRVWFSVRTLEVEPGVWILAVSYHVKRGKSGTLGCYSPLSRSWKSRTRRCTWPTEAEALAEAHAQIRTACAVQRREGADQGSGRALRAVWDRVEAWAHSFDRQLALF